MRPTAPSQPDVDREQSFDLLGTAAQDWTAQRALELLPENNGPRIEVFRGSVIVTPHGGVVDQLMRMNLAYILHRAARCAGLWAVSRVNLVRDRDLFIPDVSVMRVSGAGQIAMDMSDAVMLVEIASQNGRRKDVIDRPAQYAAAGVPWFMRVDFRNRVPAVVLHELVDEEYRPVVAAAAGTTFAMKVPFEFSIDPAELLDD